MGGLRPPEDGLRPSWDLITTFGPPPNKLAVRPPPHTQVVCPPPHTGCLSPPLYTYAVRPPQPVCGVCPWGQTSCVCVVRGQTHTYAVRPLHLCVVFVPGDKPLLSHGLTHEALYIYTNCLSPGTNKT